MVFSSLFKKIKRRLRSSKRPPLVLGYAYPNVCSHIGEHLL